MFIFGSLFFVHWWIPLIATIIASWSMFYYEAVFVGLILELLYRSDLFVVFYGRHIHLFFTIILTATVLLFDFMKKQMRRYS